MPQIGPILLTLDLGVHHFREGHGLQTEVLDASRTAVLHDEMTEVEEVSAFTVHVMQLGQILRLTTSGEPTFQNGVVCVIVRLDRGFGASLLRAAENGVIAEMELHERRQVYL